MARLRTSLQIARSARPPIFDHRGREVRMKYDAVENNNLRRKPTIERKDESDIYDQHRRLKGCNLGREIERNYSPGKGAIHQFKMNVVGSLGKLQVNADGGEDAAAWFNEVWAPDCDYRTDMHWSDWLQLTVAAIIREGDMCALFDDGLVENTGKLLTWDADQIVPLDNSAWKKSSYKGKRFSDKQNHGIVTSKYGREKAYVITSKRGLTFATLKDGYTVYPRGLARLIRNPWRHNQGRGVPSLITPAANFLDLYELLASELQTAKRAAKQYGYIKRGGDAITDFDSVTGGQEFLPENMGKTAATVAAEHPNVATSTGGNTYERFEQFNGGYVDYLAPEDEAHFPDLKHPNQQLAPFVDALHGFSGAALGMASAYIKLRADKSYTAFRGDMIMTWVTFRYWQKWVERYVADWAAVHALRWVMRTQPNQIKQLPSGWERTLSWSWPTMPEVDELDAENATAQSLKNGTTDYAKLLGPDWKKKLGAYAEQIKEIRRLGIPLAILEGNYGTANPKKEQNRNGNGETS